MTTEIFQWTTVILLGLVLLTSIRPKALYSELRSVDAQLARIGNLLEGISAKVDVISLVVDEYLEKEMAAEDNEGKSA